MSATHLLDTSVFSQPLKRKPVKVALDRWAALGDARLAVSVISEAEVRYGIEWTGAAVQRQEFESTLVKRLPILIVDSAVAQTYAIIRADLRHRGASHRRNGHSHRRYGQSPQPHCRHLEHPGL